jgi:intron-binding protein aquarius
VGSKRRLRLHLDPAQYHADATNGVSHCYDSFNLLVRRKPKENNFKAVLQTIRSLMSSAAVGRAIPAWLHDIFLGYGDPKAANYSQLVGAKNGKEHYDYRDTFLDAQHLLDSFPTAQSVEFISADGKKVVTNGTNNLPPPPYMVDITAAAPAAATAAAGLVVEPAAKKGKKAAPKATKAAKTTAAASAAPSTPVDGSSTSTGPRLVVTAYESSTRGPYPADQCPTNTMRFTPTQVEAIRSGLNPVSKNEVSKFSSCVYLLEMCWLCRVEPYRTPQSYLSLGTRIRVAPSVNIVLLGVLPLCLHCHFVAERLRCVIAVLAGPRGRLEAAFRAT